MAGGTKEKDFEDHIEFFLTQEAKEYKSIYH